MRTLSTLLLTVFATACGSTGGSTGGASTPDVTIADGTSEATDAVAGNDTVGATDADTATTATQGVNQPCIAGSDCAAPLVCAATSHICIACEKNQDCGAGHTCVAQKCVVGLQCTSDMQCKGMGGICDKVSSVCVGCLTSVDCADNKSCENQVCVIKKPCQSSTDCPNVCDKAAGSCVECVSDADCSGGKWCDASRHCQQRLCTDGACLDGKALPCLANGSGFGTPVACDDGNACTPDTCGKGTCSHGAPLQCDDSDACTVDSCLNGGCSHTATAKCGDGVCAKPCETPVNCLEDCGPPPQIAVSPSALAWGYVAPNTQESSQLTISNNGAGELTCSAFLFTASAPVFTIQALGGLTAIAPSSQKVSMPTPPKLTGGQSAIVTVIAAPIDAKLHTATLTLYCNDPSQANGTAIAMKLNAEVPCLKLNPTTLNFGGVLAAGGASVKTVTLTSCGGTELCLSSIALAGSTAAPGEFTLDFSAMQAVCPAIDVANGPTKAAPCCIGAGGKSTTFAVNYAPVDVSPADPNNPGQQLPDTANIQVDSDAFASSPPTVAVSGTGVLQVCPTAKIDVTEGDEVVPQTTLHLKGDGSKGVGGQAIKTYKWTVTQPKGSQKGFLPNSTFPNPSFTPDTAGEYEFCLEVTDANGVKSCAATCQKVLVVPNNAVHIELLWNTPADTDQTDSGPAAGADMDLHFANYLASGPDLDCDGTGDPWFHNPFDCFWFNNSPEWGSANKAIKDDPTLDLDDTDGAGPENLNLEYPEGTPTLAHSYAIGAHYWNDHQYGVSTATVVIYLFGWVALKIEDVAMNPLDMWYVGKLNWPNQLTGASTQPLTVCYQTLGSKAGDVCAGTAKMWQAKGEWCITPCYANPTFAASVGGATPSNCKP